MNKGMIPPLLLLHLSFESFVHPYNYGPHLHNREPTATVVPDLSLLNLYLSIIQYPNNSIVI